MATEDEGKTPVRCVRVLELEHAVYTVDWSPDGTRLGIGDDEGGVEVITSEGRRLWRRTEHRRPVYDVRWSPDGQRLASGGHDKAVKIWNALDGSVPLARQTHRRALSVSWSSGAGQLACGTEDEVVIFNAGTGEQVDPSPVRDEDMFCARWAPRGPCLAVGLMSGAIWSGDESRSGKSHHLKGHADKVRDLAWAQDGQRLASASADRRIRIWNVAERKCVACLRGHGRSVESVSWCPAGDLLASGSVDRTVRIWSTETGQALACLNDHGDWVWCVAFSPEGARLASASNDKTVRIWDVSDLLPR